MSNSGVDSILHFTTESTGKALASYPRCGIPLPFFMILCDRDDAISIAWGTMNRVAAYTLPLKIYP